MSKISAIDKKNQKPQAVEQQPQEPQPQFMNLADMPDGEYKLINKEEVAVKIGEMLNIFDVVTFVGADGLTLRAGLLNRQYRLKKENRIITPDMALGGSVVSFRK